MAAAGSGTKAATQLRKDAERGTAASESAEPDQEPGVPKSPRAEASAEPGPRGLQGSAGGRPRVGPEAAGAAVRLHRAELVALLLRAWKCKSQAEIEALADEVLAASALLQESLALERLQAEAGQRAKEADNLELASLQAEARQRRDEEQRTKEAHVAAKAKAKAQFCEGFSPLLLELMQAGADLQQEGIALDKRCQGELNAAQRAELLELQGRYDAVALRAMRELRAEDVAVPRTRVAETEAGFAKVYGSIHTLIQTEEAQGFKAVSERLASLPAGSVRNAVTDVAELVEAAERAQPEVSALAQTIAAAVDAQELQVEPVKTSGKRKQLGRILEKLNNSARDRQDASRVYDCARAMIACSNMAAIDACLAAMVGTPGVCVDRVKDRFTTPSSGGWADAMVNFHFTDGAAAGHVCEVQLVHTKLLLARAGLGGHDAYGAFRATLELLEVFDAVDGACGVHGPVGVESLEVRLACERPVGPLDVPLVRAAAASGAALGFLAPAATALPEAEQAAKGLCEGQGLDGGGEPPLHALAVGIVGLKLGDEKGDKRRAAALALGRLGEHAAPFAPHTPVALGRLGEHAAPFAPKLAELLGDENKNVRQAAAVALVRLGEHAAAGAWKLVELLGAENALVRKAAAGALGSLGEHAAPFAPKLAELLGDEDSEVRGAAAARYIVGNPEAIALGKTVKKRRFFFSFP